MGAGPLIIELERAGICLTPSDQDAKRAVSPSPLVGSAVAAMQRSRDDDVDGGGAGGDVAPAGGEGGREALGGEVEDGGGVDQPGCGVILKER